MIGGWMLILLFVLLFIMSIGACYDMGLCHRLYNHYTNSNYDRYRGNLDIPGNRYLGYHDPPRQRHHHDHDLDRDRSFVPDVVVRQEEEVVVGVELPVQESGESVTVDRERALEGCSICLDVLGGGDDDKAAALSCDHMFHLHCIVEWTTKVKWCPLCRRDVDKVIVSKIAPDLGTSPLITSTTTTSIVGGSTSDQDKDRDHDRDERDRDSSDVESMV